jgi:hypothetical protein
MFPLNNFQYYSYFLLILNSLTRCSSLRFYDEIDLRELPTFKQTLQWHLRYHCLATASKQSLLGKGYNNADSDMFFMGPTQVYIRKYSVVVLSSSSELRFSTTFKVLQCSLLSSASDLQFFKFVCVYCATIINIYRTVKQVVVSSYIDMPQIHELSILSTNLSCLDLSTWTPY